MSRTLEAESGYRIILVWRLSYLLILFSSVHGYPSRAHMFIYAVCSEEKYQPNAPFEGNLNSFMSSVVSSSSEVTYNSFAIGNGSSTPQEGNVYGLYQCRGDLHPIECSKCVERSVNEIGLVCPYALGASLQLEGCLIRYEHSGDFLGKLDTSLRFKKCSKGVTSDVEFFRRRDDVLADLQTANGFRMLLENSKPYVDLLQQLMCSWDNVMLVTGHLAIIMNQIPPTMIKWENQLPLLWECLEVLQFWLYCSQFAKKQLVSKS
ncbi:plasmodesmata-located protein 8-like isoform X2 [Vigna umbellata]|uniref:plasmodesmata-located protein 8-like isoform X2 n=1 Tax=Vigna umbellata TaxID=87088 RepID=UPI001F5E4262|nr:plasmodesmata-located protein 8-like isoform X2 [Vigna umbellata]